MGLLENENITKTEELLQIVNKNKMEEIPNEEEIEIIGNNTNSSSNNNDIKDSNKVVISISNGDFEWSKNTSAVLKNIDIEIKKGDLVVIIGQVGMFFIFYFLFFIFY